MPFHHHPPKTQEAIKQHVKRIDRSMQTMGMAQMAPAEMRQAAERIAHGVEAMRQQGRIPAANAVGSLPLPPGIPPEVVEGGAVNPRSLPYLRRNP